MPIQARPGGLLLPGRIDLAPGRQHFSSRIMEIGVSTLEKAYILLTVEIDSRSKVLDLLREIPEVKETYQLYGVYDFIVHVEAETMQDLKELIEKRIRIIREIRSTLSLICI